MTQKEKCIGKWEKKIIRLKRLLSNPRYGHLLNEERALLPLAEEALKDLKRIR